MMDVMYSAEGSNAPTVSYFERAAFSTPEATEILKRYLGAAFGSVRAGLVMTHAVDAAVLARGRSPALLFSHGGGEARETYTTQLADLASHGYVVAAITHTFDSVLAVFPDGRHAPMVPDRWPPPKTSDPVLPPSEEASPERLRWWADEHAVRA